MKNNVGDSKNIKMLHEEMDEESDEEYEVL